MNEVVVGRKHPEEGHHENCEPLAESVVMAQQADRKMRHIVRSSGKRPREAYSEMIALTM